MTAERWHQVRAALRWAGTGVILATLVAGPFFQGLFFPRQQHWAEAAVALGALFWLAGGGRTGGWRDPVLWGLGGLVLVSLLHFPVAVYPHGNLIVLLQYVAALLAYIVMRGQARAAPGLAAALAALLTLTALGVCAVGLASYAGILPPDAAMLEALSLVSKDARLMSTFEYPNALAGFLLFALCGLTGLAVAHGAPPNVGGAGGAGGPGRRLWLLPPAAAIGFVFVLCFILTLSRGAILTFPFAALLLVVGIPRGYRFPALLLLAATTVPAALASTGFMRHMDAQALVPAARWFAAGAVLALAGGGVMAFLLALEGRRRWQAAGALVVAAVLLAGIGYAFVPRVRSALAVPARAARLLDISLNTPNARIRIHGYFADAIDIIRESPVIGAGGRGWERQYFAHQDFHYFAAETHNHYLQTWVEGGLPGLLVLLVFPAGWLWQRWRRRRVGGPGPPTALRWGLTAGGLAVFVHSLVDFDLSYLSILLWVVVSAATAAYGREGKPRRAKSRPYWVQHVGIASAAVLIAVSLPLGLAEFHLERGKRQVAAGDAAAAGHAFLLASRLSPLQPAAYSGLASVAQDTRTADQYLEAALRRDPRDPYLWQQRLERLTQARWWDQAAIAAKSALALQPALGLRYQDAMRSWTEAAFAHFRDGDMEAGRAAVQEALAVDVQLQVRAARAEPLKDLWPSARPNPGREYRFHLGRALAMDGQYAEALPYLQEAAKIPAYQIQAETWTYLVLRELGREEDAAALEGRLWVAAVKRGINPLGKVLERAAGR